MSSKINLQSRIIQANLKRFDNLEHHDESLIIKMLLKTVIYLLDKEIERENKENE